MNSSDEELFEAMPNSSTSLTKNISHNAKNLQAKIKDVSVHLVRLPVESILNISTTNSRKKRSKFKKWKHGVINYRRKVKNASRTRNSRTSLSSDTTNKTESPAKIMSPATSLENNACSNEQYEETMRDNSKNKQNEYLTILSISDSAEYETMDNQSSSFDDVHTSARTLPYNWVTKKVLANNKSNTSSSSSVLLPSSNVNNSVEQPSCSYKDSDPYEFTKDENEANKKELYQDEAKKKELHQDEAKKKELHQDKAKKKELHHDVANKKELHQDEAKKKKLHEDKAKKKELPQDEAKRKELHHDVANKKELHQDEAKKKKLHEDKAKKKELPQDEAKRKELHQDEAKKKELHQDEVKKKELHQDEAKRKKLHQDEAKNKELHQDEAKNKELHQDEAKNEELHLDEAMRKELHEAGPHRKKYCFEKEKKRYELFKKNIAEYDKTLNDLLVRAASMRGQLDAWKLKKKRIISNDESSDDDMPIFAKRRRRAVILSDVSDDEETIPNKNAIEDDSQNGSRLSHETANPEKSHMMNINHKLRVTLTRLGDSNDVDVVKWRENRARNTLRRSTSSKSEEQCPTVTTVTDEESSMNLQDIGSLATSQSHVRTVDNTHERDSNVELIMLDNDSSTTKDTSQASPELLEISCIRSKKYDTNQLNSALKSCINLWKKYKLFRRPRVLLIKLEVLCGSYNDGIYSACEIENLTCQYMRSVIDTISISRRSSLFKFVQSEKQKSASMSITDMEKDDTAEVPSVNDTSAEYQISDNQALTGANQENMPFMNPPKLKLTLTLKKPNLEKKNNSGKTLLEIWQKAFCSQRATSQLKTATDSESTSAQSTSKSASPSSSQNAANSERTGSGPLASTFTSSKNDNASAPSSMKLSAPKNSSPIANSSHNNTRENLKVSSDSPLSKDNVTTKSLVTAAQDVTELDSPLTSRIETSKATESSEKISVDKTKSSTKSPMKSSSKPSTDSPVKLSITPSSLQSPPKSLSLESESPTKSLKNLNIPVHHAAYITSSKKTQCTYKCIVCKTSYNDYRSMRQHLATSQCQNQIKQTLCQIDIKNRIKPSHEGDQSSSSTTNSSPLSSQTNQKTPSKRSLTPQPESSNKNILFSKSKSANLDKCNEEGATDSANQSQDTVGHCDNEQQARTTQNDLSVKSNILSATSILRSVRKKNASNSTQAACSQKEDVEPQLTCMASSISPRKTRDQEGTDDVQPQLTGTASSISPRKTGDQEGTDDVQPQLTGMASSISPRKTGDQEGTNDVQPQLRGTASSISPRKTHDQEGTNDVQPQLTGTASSISPRKTGDQEGTNDVQPQLRGTASSISPRKTGDQEDTSDVQPQLTGTASSVSPKKTCKRKDMNDVQPQLTDTASNISPRKTRKRKDTNDVQAQLTGTASSISSRKTCKRRDTNDVQAQLTCTSSGISSKKTGDQEGTNVVQPQLTCTSSSISSRKTGDQEGTNVVQPQLTCSIFPRNTRDQEGTNDVQSQLTHPTSSISSRKTRDQEDTNDVQSQLTHSTSSISPRETCDQGSSTDVAAPWRVEKLTHFPPHLKLFSICKCHKNETVDNDCIQIELVLLCSGCQTLFRRLDCFQAHLKSSENTACEKDRRCNLIGKSKLFCNSCRVILPSLRNTLSHLAMHARVNPNGMVNFRCNICKIIFYEFGALFKTHARNHFRKPNYLASRLSFSQFSWVGPRLIELSNNQQRSTEVYLFVADQMCRKCMTAFTMEPALKLHANICRGNANDFRSLSKRTSSSSKSKLLLICGLCNEKFSHVGLFNLHSLEHKQNQESHYVTANITAVSKVYICKVCTTVCRSLQRFGDHWLAHKTLQENYMCDRCGFCFDSVDLFEEHAATHEKQESVSCRVIYKNTFDDYNPRANSRSFMSNNDLPCTHLSYFDKEKQAVDQIVGSNAQASGEATETGKQTSLSVEKTAPLTITENISQISERVPSATAAQGNSETSAEDHPGTTAKNNQNNVETIEEIEEELMIDEESSISNKVTQKNDVPPFVLAEENLAVARGELLLDLTTNGTPTEDSCDKNESTSSSVEAVQTASSAQNASSSKNDTQPASDKNTVDNSTGTPDAANNNGKARQSTESLPMNAMTSVPKTSFLRVKSLLELITPSDKTSPSSAAKCPQPNNNNNQSLESTQMSADRNLTPSVQQPSVQQCKQPEKPSPLPNITCAWQVKVNPMPVASLAPTITSNPPMLQAVTNNPPQFPRVIDSKSKQYQVVGVRPLHMVKYSAAGKLLKPPEKRQQQQTQQQQQQIQQTQQQSLLRQQLQHQQQQQQQQLQQQQQQQQQYSVMLTMPQQSTATSSTTQKPAAYHRNLPARIAQPILSSRVAQPVAQQQSSGTAAVLPMVQNTYVQQQKPPPSYISTHLIVNQQPQPMYSSFPIQQQQQQQQQQPNIGGEILCGTYLPIQPPNSENSNVNAFQLVNMNAIMNNPMAASNVTTAPAGNNAMQGMYMLQVARNPDRFTCLYCPGFECNTVQEFMIHERSPKHVNRSNYNDMTWT